MSYNVLTIPLFDKEVKRLTKKYPSLKNHPALVIKSLKTDPSQGTPPGKGCYKIRLAISSKNKGKSGGARIVTCVVVDETSVYLLSIYDKATQSDIKDDELLTFNVCRRKLKSTRLNLHA
jgi:mRNA-degrading endonuclease RelE of RelBE toxin-antitoxin system